jgi:hypothetical protein
MRLKLTTVILQCSIFLTQASTGMWLKYLQHILMALKYSRSRNKIKKNKANDVTGRGGS